MTDQQKRIWTRNNIRHLASIAEECRCGGCRGAGPGRGRQPGGAGRWPGAATWGRWPGQPPRRTPPHLISPLHTYDENKLDQNVNTVCVGNNIVHHL
ncbi:unnamed protein product [Plutella xylostella]|uniref:(diamondback moth) hypothetical protein n=1 Tax=Plutella xylostella TaxID=51655 RepID=A0A8S4DJK4_PLUXY|nr:unnamed protein product [Plutella xylostella]